ncbi:MAG TPA: hypothetical protein VN886_09850, partial [Acidimicrobiales bacterium]|nr:hypothetical protein [Acidimicrobiales bacterium]
MPLADFLHPDDHSPIVDVVGFGSLNLDYIVQGPTSVGYFDKLEHGREYQEEDIDRLERGIRNLYEAESIPLTQLGGSALNM